MTTFHEFGLDEGIVAAVEKLGFESATPIQEATIPTMLSGQDVIGRARTGSGKTAAFGLPMLERLKAGGKKPRGLVLAPTRELALQVSEALRSFSKSLPVKVTTIYGGAPYPPQLKALRNEPGIVVGTPGRVIDHIQRGNLDLSCVEMFVIDEADEMLRMGFIEPVQEILECLPEERQIALFSATMPPAIRKVASRFLRDPSTIQVETSALTTDHIEQFWIRVPMRKKIDALIRLILTDPTGYSLIFTRTRRGCAEICDLLTRQGISADAIHGDLNQAARERVLNRMRGKSLRVLVATDVAARGLDVSHLSRVINVDYPESAETYTHRIGRTGRAGAKGTAITFVTPSEQYKLRFLKNATKSDIQEMFPPTNAEIAAHQREILWTELEKVLTEESLEHETKWIEQQCADSDVDPLALASAALRILNESRGMSLAPPKAEPKQHRRENREDPTNRSQRASRGPRDNGEFSRVNEVEIFVGVGKFAGVSPGDIVGAFANEFGVAGSDIGRVMLFDKNSFIGLPRAVAEQVLDKHEKVTIRGRTTYLSLARGRNDSGSGGGGGGSDDSGGGNGPPPRRKPKFKHIKKGPSNHRQNKKFKR